MSNYMFLLLSHWDLAPPNVKSPENYIRRGGEELQELEKICKGGCYTIINKIGENDKQVERIIEGIDNNLERIKAKHFKDVLFKGIETCIAVKEATSTVGSLGIVISRFPQSEEEIEASKSSEEYKEDEPQRDKAHAR